MTQFAPSYQPQGMDPLTMLLLMKGMKSDGGRQQQGASGGGGLGKLALGGGGLYGASEAGLFGGGGEAAAAMSLPEISGLSLSGGLPMSIGAPAAAEGGMSVGAPAMEAAGMSPLLGMAGVAATPLVGKMIGRQLAGPSLRPRPYDANEMLKHNSLGQRFKGFDESSSETKKKIADILGHDAKGSDSLFSNSHLGGPTPDYDFALPGVVNRNELADKMNRMRGGMGVNQKGWGNKATAKSYFDGVSAREMFDAAEPSILNKKMSGDIEGKLKAIESLLSGKQQAPSPKPKAPEKVTPMPRTVPEIVKQSKGSIPQLFKPAAGMIPKGKWG